MLVPVSLRHAILTAGFWPSFIAMIGSKEKKSSLPRRARELRLATSLTAYRRWRSFSIIAWPSSSSWSRALLV